MNLKITILLLAVTFCLQAQSDVKEIIHRLDDVIVYEARTIGGFMECYKIMVKQPINHSDTTEGFFYQKVFLAHKGFDKPMVMNINGYISFSHKISDWTQTLDANQLYIEHRYFGESKPKTVNYNHLNISNASQDLHRIREMFNEIYQNGWISVGLSKGGLTALSYRYFFPDDVDATIALSTSIKTTKCDTSYFQFIDSLNTTHRCNKEIENFQKSLITRKKEIIPHLKKHLIHQDKQYARLGLETIYEIAVLEIPFSIWQNGSGCRMIDASITDSNKLFSQLNSSLNGWFMTDDIFNLLDPYHYQALTELGHYCYPTSKYSKHLNSEHSKLLPVQPIRDVKTNYSNQLMVETKDWAENHGNQIIYLSGTHDPYSIQRIIPNESLDSRSYLLQSKNHNQVLSYHMDEAMVKEITNLIHHWINKEDFK